eukprot:Gb_23866 [translate_table: standard]
MVISEMWTDKQSSSNVAIQVRATILDDRFWVDVKFIVDVIKLIVDVICYGDRDTPCLGEVFENLDSMCEQMKDKELYKTLEKKIHKRWHRLNTLLHMATYAINPKWYDTEKTRKRAPFNDEELAHGLMACIKKIYGDKEARTLI